jgi:type II secretory pathway pseudopilin PulG
MRHFEHSASLLRKAKAFTLLEILIVGALIALFSGMAIFGIQQQFRSNVRKAAIAETRQIATALDFANLDTEVFPRLCWLSESREGLDLFSARIDGSDSPYVFSRLDVGGRVTYENKANALRNLWAGPYFALSQTRSGLSQGRGGFCYMLFDDMPATDENSPSTNYGYRWPADPYNSPYVVYMLDVNVASESLSFANYNNPLDNEKGNYANAVVSYGENLIPGGPDSTKVPFNGANTVDALGDSGYQFRLFKGRPGFVSDKGLITHKYLTISEFVEDRAAVWNSQFFTPAVTSWYGAGPGITDSGSDDIIFEF